MLITRVMPCLLLSGGALVKTVQFKTPKYIGDPINAIRIYNDKEVDELILLDIEASVKRHPPMFELISKVSAECCMPMCYGGGVHSIEDMRKIFGLGVEKISLNSLAVDSPEVVEEAVRFFGGQSIVLSVDVKQTQEGYEVFTLGGRKGLGLHPVEYVRKYESIGVGEVLLNSIDRDGMMNGLDISLIEQVSSAVKIPVIACGGAGSLMDIGNAVHQGRASAVALGSMVVYHGRQRAVLINFPTRAEINRVLEKHK